MNSFKGGAVAAVGALALAGCHMPSFGPPKAPTGQVVATVGDREITLRELHAEMGSTGAGDAKARKAQEQAAIRNIVARVLLAKAARDQGLDKTPDFELQKGRVLDGLLVQTLQQKVVAAVPAPTREEAQAYVAAHPDTFVERKVFLVDQIRMPRPSDPAILKALQPLKTLEQIEEVLKKDNIPFQRTGGSLDSVGPDPRLIETILKLPPNEIFVVPGADGLLVNQVKQTKVVPFTGEPAVSFAQKMITRQRTQEILNRTFSDLIKKGSAQTRFNKDYQPTVTPSAPAAAKPAGKP